MRNISVKLLDFGTSGSGDGCSLQGYFLSRALAALFFQWSGILCAILIEGIMKNILAKTFWIWTRSRCCLKKAYLDIWQPSCPKETICSISVEGIMGLDHGEHSCEIIFNLCQWFRRCSLTKTLQTMDACDCHKRLLIFYLNLTWWQISATRFNWLYQLLLAKILLIINFWAKILLVTNFWT